MGFTVIIVLVLLLILFIIKKVERFLQVKSMNKTVDSLEDRLNKRAKERGEKNKIKLKRFKTDDSGLSVGKSKERNKDGSLDKRFKENR